MLREVSMCVWIFLFFRDGGSRGVNFATVSGFQFFVLYMGGFSEFKEFFGSFRKGVVDCLVTWWPILAGQAYLIMLRLFSGLMLSSPAL